MGLIYKPLSESTTLECALVWRIDNRRRTCISFLNAVYEASQPPRVQDNNFASQAVPQTFADVASKNWTAKGFRVERSAASRLARSII